MAPPLKRLRALPLSEKLAIVVGVVLGGGVVIYQVIELFIVGQ
jgi:hypothetical protein